MSIELLSFKQASAFLNVKESWLRMMVFRQEIPVVKLGRLIRFRKSDLIVFINNNIRGEIDISLENNSIKEESWS